MPTYQYRCSECGQDLEVVQKFSDAALTECPNCSGKLRKVYNAVGVVFKGSGFYSTDSRSNRNGSKPASSNGESSGSSGESSSGESSSSGNGSAKSSGTGSSDASKNSSGSTSGSSSPAPAKAAAG